MLRTFVSAVIGAGLGAALGYLTYRLLGALDILYVPTKGSMDFTVLMAHIAAVVGAAAGGIVGSVIGAAAAIIQAIERSGPAAEPFSPYVGPAKQRL